MFFDINNKIPRFLNICNNFKARNNDAALTFHPEAQKTIDPRKSWNNTSASNIFNIFINTRRGRRVYLALAAGNFKLFVRASRTYCTISIGKSGARCAIRMSSRNGSVRSACNICTRHKSPFRLKIFQRRAGTGVSFSVRRCEGSLIDLCGLSREEMPRRRNFMVIC